MSREPKGNVVGRPIADTRSPVIDRFGPKELGIRGDYVVAAIASEEITTFLQDFPKNEFCVGNITVLHKKMAINSIEYIEAAVEVIGVLNNLWIELEKLYCDNMYLAGFLACLDIRMESGYNYPRSGDALGAGCATRAVIHALSHRDFVPIHLVNRFDERAEALAKRFGSAVRPVGLDAARRLLHQAIRGFGRWFGRRPVASVALRTEVLRALEA